MNEINLVQITVETSNYGGQNLPLNKSTYSAISASEIARVTKLYENKTSIESLDEDLKVYFDTKVIFPKRKFQNSYRTNKIVNSPEKADVIIGDLDGMKSRISCIWLRPLVQTKTGNWTYTNNSGLCEKDAKTEHFSYIEPPQNTLKDLNTLIKCAEKPILSVAKIGVKTEEYLDDEGYDRVKRMLASEDSNMIEMGMRILTAYNYNTSKYRIATLLKNYYNRWRVSKTKPPNIELKALLNTVFIEFPDAKWAHVSSDMAFWFNMALECPEDNLIQNEFNNWIAASSRKKFDKLKITKV